MGNALPSTDASHMASLLAMGYTHKDAKRALDDADGDLTRAAHLLKQRNQPSTHAHKINNLLQEQKSWAEFTERFLYPDHPRERILTNLLYYRANYALICALCTLLFLLLNPAVLLAAAASSLLLLIAFVYDTPALHLEQRLAMAGLGASLILQRSGFMQVFACCM